MRFAELSVKNGGVAPVPSLFINEKLAFEMIPPVKELEDYLKEILNDLIVQRLSLLSMALRMAPEILLIQSVNHSPKNLGAILKHAIAPADKENRL